MFSVKLKVKEGPRTNSLPRRRRATPSSSFSSSTSSLSRLQNNGTKVPTKSSFLSNKNGKNNKKVRIQTTYEPSSSSYYGRCSLGQKHDDDLCKRSFSLFFISLGALEFSSRTGFDTHSKQDMNNLKVISPTVYGVRCSRLAFVSNVNSRERFMSKVLCGDVTQHGISRARSLKTTMKKKKQQW